MPDRLAEPTESADTAWDEVLTDLSAEDLLAEDLLVEEISIDGLCGVY